MSLDRFEWDAEKALFDQIRSARPKPVTRDLNEDVAIFDDSAAPIITAHRSSSSTSSSTAPREGNSTSWLRGLREHVWLEPVLRLLGMGLFLVGLSGIGAVATMYGRPGLAEDAEPMKLAARLGGAWLKPTPPTASSAVTTPRASAAIAPPPVAASAPRSSSTPNSEISSGPAPSTTSAVDPAPGDTPSGMTGEGKVILNRASAEDLMKLPGVGQKRALAILALRSKLGRFRQATELLRVKGIGPRGLKRMLPHLVLDGA